MGYYRRTDGSNNSSYERAPDDDVAKPHVKFAPTVARLATEESDDEDTEGTPLRQLFSMKAASMAAALMPGYRKRKSNGREGGLLRGRARQRSMSLGRVSLAVHLW